MNSLADNSPEMLSLIFLNNNKKKLAEDSHEVTSFIKSKVEETFVDHRVRLYS